MGVITISSGVQFEVNQVSPFTIQEKQDALLPDRPQVPVVHITEDDRNVEVPEDPKYQAALLAWQARVVRETYDLLIVLGTKLVQVPEGVQKPDDTEWAEDLALVGIKVPPAGKARYLAWMRHYACRTTDDVTKVITSVQRLAGVTEEDAAKAAAMFQGRT